MLTQSKHEKTTVNYHFDLPPFPSTATRLVAALDEPSTPVRQVIQLIECEPKISARVLSLSNSPLYGATRSITSIGHAVVILGFRSVSNLALTAAAGSLFAQGDAECGLVRKETYIQSLAIGTLARLFARQAEAENPDEAFLTGVMHDIGKLVLLNTDGLGYVGLISADELGNTVVQERLMYGTSHPELGQACGQKWGLPPSMVTAIGNHHESIQNVADSSSFALIAANYAARCWHIGFEENQAISIDANLEDYITSLGDPDLPTKSAEQFAAICDICSS